MIIRLLKIYRGLSPVVKAGIWFTICNFLQKGISFITVPIFTRIMSTEEYGLFSVYSSWYHILTVFGTLQLSYFVFDKGMVKYDDDRDRFLVSIQSLSGALTLFLFFVYFLAKRWIDHLIQIPSAMLICMLIQIFFEPPVLYWTARKRFEYKYNAVIIVTLAIAILNPVLGICFIKLNLFSSAAFARVLSIVILSIAFGSIFSSVIIKEGKAFFSRKYWPYALNFNLPLIPHFLSTTVLSSADKIMIGDMVGKSESAIYSVAYSVGIMITLFSQAIQHAYLPWLYRRIKSTNYAGTSRISSIFLIGMMTIISLLICFAPDVVLIVGSSKYSDAIWIVPPICGSVFFIFLRDLFANIEYYFEKTKLVSAASVGVAVLNVILNYVFINKYGFYAAGFTTLFCYILFSFVHYNVMKHICKENGIEVKMFFNLKVILLLSVIMLSVIGCMLCVYKYNILRYTILSVLLLIILGFRKTIMNVLTIIHDK